MGPGWPMFSENILMLHQQDLLLGPYFVKWQMTIDQGLPRFPIIILQTDCSGPNSRGVLISEN